MPPKSHTLCTNVSRPVCGRSNLGYADDLAGPDKLAGTTGAYSPTGGTRARSGWSQPAFAAIPGAEAGDAGVRHVAALAKTPRSRYGTLRGEHRILLGP